MGDMTVAILYSRFGRPKIGHAASPVGAGAYFPSGYRREGERCSR